MAKILMRTMSGKECSMRSASRGSSSTAANCWVKPMRWSNWRSGSRPASEVSGASATWMWMGKGWKKSNGSSAADCAFTVNSVVSRGVLWVSLETSFDAISVIDAGADHIQEGVTRKVGVAGVVERFGGGPGEPEALVELADGQQP